jgi:hypothetical protein
MTPSKPTIVFDCDDTLCDFMGPALALIYSLTGKQFELASLSSGMWINDMLTPIEFAAVEKELFNPTFYLRLMTTQLGMDLAHHADAAELRKKFNFHLITARARVLQKALMVTNAWLSNQGLNMDGITITYPKESKVLVAPRNTRVVVEDSSKVAQDALDHHLTVILIDKPWNQEIKDQPGLTRVSNDAQVLATLCHTLL